MKKIYIAFLACFCFSTVNLFAQNTFPSTGNAGVGTTTPDASSILELKSTTQGFLPPRMTKLQRNAIISPAKGLMIYQTNSTPGFYYYNGTNWIIMKPETTTYTAGQGISIANGVITNLGDFNAGDDITINTAAGGDLVGNYPSPQVAKLQGVTIFPVAPTTNQVLKYNGSYWIPSIDDNTTYSAGNGLNLSGTVFTNTAPDQTVTLTGSGGTTVSGTYPNFTINSTDNDAQTLSLNGNNLSISNGNTVTLPQGAYSAGTGIDITGTTITNTAPSQWGTAGSAIFYSGNVGIGNSKPEYKLDITGDINLNKGGIVRQDGDTVFYCDETTKSLFLGINKGGNYLNAILIGNDVLGTANNQVRIGNKSITSIGGFTDWTNISDGRVKRNIKENVPGLAFINKLKPVTYNLDLDAADRISKVQPAKDKDGKIIQSSQAELKARQAKMQSVYTGFVAQEVEKVAKSLNYNFSGVDVPQNDKTLYGLRYAEFVVPLVKAVQELSKQNNDKDAAINDLKNQVNELKTMMQTIQQKFEACNPCSAASNASTSQTSTQIISVSSASLEQNIPNPFNNATVINYTLPQAYSSAKIIITDKNGKTLKEINVSGKGKGNIKVDASTLANGAYQYSLYMSNKLIASKQMILSK